MLARRRRARIARATATATPVARAPVRSTMRSPRGAAPGWAAPRRMSIVVARRHRGRGGRRAARIPSSGGPAARRRSRRSGVPLPVRPRGRSLPAPHSQRLRGQPSPTPLPPSRRSRIADDDDDDDDEPVRTSERQGPDVRTFRAVRSAVVVQHELRSGLHRDVRRRFELHHRSWRRQQRHAQPQIRPPMREAPATAGPPACL
jgi:hypothetical protein